METNKKIVFFIAFLFFTGSYIGGHSQTYFGIKAGVNATKVSFDSEVYKQFYESKFKPGYTLGAIFLIENQEKYGLYTEFLYSVKSKSVVSNANDYETNMASYHFLDFPVMFRMKFNKPKFSWFLQAGPEISYWLSGTGAFDIYESDRDALTTYKYKINFGEHKNTSDYMNVEDANRLQIGLAFGGGMVWKLKNANFLSLDMRYSIGHTFMGGYESGSIPNLGLVDNFEYTNNVLSISAVYFFDIREKMKLSKNKYKK